MAALAKEISVYWLVDKLILPERAAAGWVPIDVEGVRIIKVDGFKEVDQALELVGNADYHVIAPRGCSSANIVLKKIPSSRLIFLAETPDGRGLFLLLKRLLYAFYAARYQPRYFAAMGKRGADWYKLCGFRNVFPFGYTVRESRSSLSAPIGETYRFICVARLVPLKRVGDLLKALSKINCGGWHVVIVGDGPLRAQLMELAARLNLVDRVTWRGVLPSDVVRDEIAKSDTLVLSSEWEGWGAVVNEAIAEGTRVCVSDQVQSACLISLGDIGATYRCGDIADLAQRLREHISLGRVQNTERQTRRQKHLKINGSAFASYFLDKIRGGQSLPPWHSL
jgi:glycosyltransferase involved in cell wall biosynthesis